MGTRHLIAVVIDNQIKVAQYGQWDGYPTGQGFEIVNFLQEADLDGFRINVRECSFISGEEVDNLYNKFGAEVFYKEYPQFNRDTGAKILKLVEAEPLKLYDNTSFAGDSLFCEYAYVLDLDNDILEVYKGFNQKPVDSSERFANIKINDDYRDEKYLPVRLIEKIPFSEVTEEKMRELEALMAAISEQEYEEEQAEKSSTVKESAKVIDVGELLKPDGAIDE